MSLKNAFSTQIGMGVPAPVRIDTSGWDTTNYPSGLNITEHGLHCYNDTNVVKYADKSFTELGSDFEFFFSIAGTMTTDTYAGIGLAFLSASSQAVLYILRYTGYIEKLRYNNTSYVDATQLFSIGSFAAVGRLYFKAVGDYTAETLTLYISLNGLNWTLMGSESIAAGSHINGSPLDRIRVIMEDGSTTTLNTQFMILEQLTFQQPPELFVRGA